MTEFDWGCSPALIAKFNAQYTVNTHIPRMMAGSLALLAPVLIIYGIFQKRIMASVMFSSVKE
jgi:multiple sugar transport system permease protein